MRSSICTRSAVILLAGALGVAAAPVMARADGPPAARGETAIDEHGVVHYRFNPVELPGARATSEMGSREDGVCLFVGSGRGAARGLGVARLTVMRELSFDPATCRRELAIARYPSDGVPRPVAEEFDLVISPAEKSSGVEAEAVAAYWQGVLDTQVRDPPGIVVSRTKATHRWWTSGAVAHGNNWYWFEPSGWSRTSHSATNNSLLTDVRGKFKNTWFCDPNLSTYTNHSKTEFVGYNNGTYDWSYKMSKSGDCSSLLNYNYGVWTP